MDWDQQCFMPKGGADARAEQSSILSRMAHEIFVSDETQRALEESEKQVEPGSVDAAIVRVTRRNMDLSTKIPASMVEREAKLAALGHEAWVGARKNNDFPTFAPILAELFQINREKAELLGYTGHIYDALLDIYEEGATAEDCRAMFDTIRGPIVDLVKEIKNAPQPDDSFLYGDFSADRQRAFTEQIAKAIGYDFDRGRQDTAPHPFCTNFSVSDVRITTRFQDYVGSALYGTLHECGHALYELGSPTEWDRLPVAGGVSLGVHESQSRLWENIVGRSRAFTTWMLPKMQSFFPELNGIDHEKFYKAINKVKPSLIRVEADEVTYNLHVMVRFEIECAILTGELNINDLPEAWNAKYEEYLGIRPDSNANGCLQDVHWSMGSIGYFPTYSMGNLLSYQIWNTLLMTIPDADDQMARGEFSNIHAWLKENIYQHGSRYTPKELVHRVTGKPMGADDYVKGLTAKYREVYGLPPAAV